MQFHIRKRDPSIYERSRKTQGHGSLYAGIAFSLPIAFSTSLEDFVIEMKLTAPVPVDTAVHLKP